MTSQLKPIKLWGIAGPNPPKVRMVLEELGLPYEPIAVGLGDVKNEPYISINPNGRIPAIHDPNTDLTLWESGAIVLYLIDKYDTENKISFPKGSNESYLAEQWLFFQVSGQGPYYGQSIYFKRYHHEKVQSTEDRFNKEINRVTGVLDGWLAKQETGADGPWLVGGKFSYADLAFINWQNAVKSILAKDTLDMAQYPHVQGWIERMEKRPLVKFVLEEVEKAYRALKH
jgi:glutathione S-transferase